MTCENALELMNRELDEALTESESAALRTHLDACPDCRETWRQLHELDALLQDGELEPPAALHDGVMQAIRQEQKQPRRAWVPAAAIAAAAALVLLAGRAHRTKPPHSRRRSFPPRLGWTCCWCGTEAFRPNWNRLHMKRSKTVPGCTV